MFMCLKKAFSHPVIFHVNISATEATPPSLIITHVRCVWAKCLRMTSSPRFPQSLTLALPLSPRDLSRLRARTGTADDLEVVYLHCIRTYSTTYINAHVWEGGGDGLH